MGTDTKNFQHSSIPRESAKWPKNIKSWNMLKSWKCVQKTIKIDYWLKKRDGSQKKFLQIIRYQLLSFFALHEFFNIWSQLFWSATVKVSENVLCCYRNQQNIAVAQFVTKFLLCRLFLMPSESRCSGWSLFKFRGYSCAFTRESWYLQCACPLNQYSSPRVTHFKRYKMQICDDSICVSYFLFFVP